MLHAAGQRRFSVKLGLAIAAARDALFKSPPRQPQDQADAFLKSVVLAQVEGAITIRRGLDLIAPVSVALEQIDADGKMR